jgi:PII-like signaling protein
MGYGAHRQMRQDKRLSRSHDRPIQLSVIDDDAKIRAFLPLLDSMLGDGLVVLSTVDVVKYTHRLPASPTSEAHA